MSDVIVAAATCLLLWALIAVGADEYLTRCLLDLDRGLRAGVRLLLLRRP